MLMKQKFIQNSEQSKNFILWQSLFFTQIFYEQNHRLQMDQLECFYFFLFLGFFLRIRSLFDSKNVDV